MKKGQDGAMAKGGLKMKTVAELLKAKPARVVSVRPEQSVLEAIKVLAEEDIGAAIVMTGGRLVGIFSERDYTRKIILKGRSSETTRVEEIMTPNVIVVNPRTKTRECMALMTDRRIRHVPVVDGGEVMGIVSIGDVVKFKSKQQSFEIKYLTDYITSG